MATCWTFTEFLASFQFLLDDKPGEARLTVALEDAPQGSFSLGAPASPPAGRGRKKPARTPALPGILDRRCGTIAERKSRFSPRMLRNPSQAQKRLNPTIA
jgi:hypothetical protein